MLNLKEKVFDHPLCEIEAIVLEKTKNDEVAVPPVHFIEAAAGNDVTIFQIEQPGWIERRGIDFAQTVQNLRQMLHMKIATLLQLLHGGRYFKVGRNIQHGR